MEKKKRVLSLGTVAMDVILETRELPKEDGFGFIDSEKLLPGGSAANLSVALASYGVEAYQAGKIGDDKYGDEFRRTLVEDGVCDRFLVTKPGGSTLHTFIITAPGGKHCIIANLGDSVLDLQPEELPEDILDEIDVFYTDMFSSRASIYLGRLAKKKGIPVVYNMQCIPSFMNACGVTMEEIEEMISLSTIVSGGREGYFEITGEVDYHKGVEKFLKKYSVPQGVICTAGDEGALWYDAEESIYRDAYTVEAIDTTGAGDCFLAGFIYAYFCKGMDRYGAIEFASASAALKCMQKGPRTRATVEDVLQFIHSNK
ncbi:carbohydrate kinase family protein [Tissierella carlieri]|uniref:carbohydrate kinase family protein n=1 Tax=Tissierella TaxID=41273 RepID=UPI000BA05D26|nr:MULTISPECIES: carbohydrate kinase family protein [Tissierella]MBU5313261.1 carbohydrate kinase family protein [Tissierella carlieri]OZV12557.1 carbohydrate kinase family protein [Tissierella sp. P1]